MEVKKRPLGFRQGSKWGYIDIDGAVLHDAVFDYAGSFREQLAYIRRGRDLVIIDTTFRELGTVKNAQSYATFSDGLLSVSHRDSGRDFYVDAAGRKVFDKDFDLATSFNGERAFVQVNEKWGLLDRTGRWIVEPAFAWGAPFQAGEEITSVRLSEMGPYQLMDKQGKFVSPQKFDSLRNISEGLVPFGKRMPNGQTLFGVANIQGKEIIPPTFTECDYGFREGLLGVEIDEDKWGVIDKTGHWVIHPSYLFLGECRNGLLLAYKGGERNLDRVLYGGKFGYVKPTGEVGIDFQFDQAWPFDDGIGSVEWHCNVRSDDAFDSALGYVSQDGRTIWKEVIPEKKS